MSRIRSGFVSNSSSSSFIIAIDEKTRNECPCCGRSDKNIIDQVAAKNDDWSDSTLNCQGKDNVLSYVTRNHFTDDETIKNKLIDKINNAVNEGKEVSYISISYNDDDLNDELKTQEKQGKLEILYRLD